MTKDYIKHKGTVEGIEKHKVIVKILQKAACGDCHAKSVCLSSDRKEKIIEVYDKDAGKYRLSEDVVVSIQSTTGHYAVLLAFIIPLTFVISIIFIGIKITGNEGVSGLIGLSVLIAYYTILYFFRNKLKRTFVFTLSKAEAEIVEQPLKTVTN